ncbi:MAG: hypothetical protein JW850_21990, partial [Thermoflexales bacterium]|nr:hypothetical protein [Thermoflexales bacterium]
AEHAESAEFLKFFSAASALSAVKEFWLRREACRAMNQSTKAAWRTALRFGSLHQRSSCTNSKNIDNVGVVNTKAAT